jgi:LAO/AO transport system kinase
MTSPLVERILARDVRAVARAISKIEDDAPDAGDILKSLFARTGQGLVIGVTGAPGAGKSSLVDKLALQFRRMDRTVAIVAVDPSSPFSGGAILGDRIRMQALASDPNVFIRSMATRGNLGGLARATADAVTVLDAAGYDRTLVETVGVGQDEVDIVKTADCTVVVLVPGMGDDIQAIKAGIMEIGDVFVINKAERDGVERTERELLSLLEMSDRSDGWRPPIVRTVATKNKGIAELAEAIERYAAFRLGHAASLDRRADAAETRLLELLRERLLRRVLAEAMTPEQLRELASAVASRQRDPYSIVEEIAGRIRFEEASPGYASLPACASGDASLPACASGDASLPACASGYASLPACASGDASLPACASGYASLPACASGENPVIEAGLLTKRTPEAMRTEENPMKTTIQHLGVAVASIDEALAFWRDALGLELREIEVVADQGVRVAMLPIGESRIELLEATSDDTPVGKFIAKRGVGIHHLCVEVADLASRLADLKARGIRLIDAQPRTGAGGALVAFVHPASTGGVLIELTQAGSGAHA